MRNIISMQTITATMVIPMLLILIGLAGSTADASVRVKDIANFHTSNEVDLIGYGLVIGLDGSGDGKGAAFTMQSLANMMERMGMTVDVKKLKVKNVAAVMVTARLSSRNKIGDRIDVTVSSVGDASSLQGGTLLLTPLSSATGDVYGIAQGPVSIGGFNVQVDDGSRIINNYTLVGRIPSGAQISTELQGLSRNSDILLTLRTPDYNTATRITKKINLKYGLTAYTENEAAIRIVVPDSLSYTNLRGQFIADIGQMRIVPDQPARVVINERTGTIVAGQYVTLSPVAIAHGNITVNIKTHPVISQPEPFSGGETVYTNEYELGVDDEQARVVQLEEAVTLADVAGALNSLGAAPRDIIAIFQALKQAGALRAELVIL